MDVTILATPPTTLPYNEKIHVSTGLLKNPSSLFSRFIKLGTHSFTLKIQIMSGNLFQIFDRDF